MNDTVYVLASIVSDYSDTEIGIMGIFDTEAEAIEAKNKFIAMEKARIKSRFSDSALWIIQKIDNPKELKWPNPISLNTFGPAIWDDIEGRYGSHKT